MQHAHPLLPLRLARRDGPAALLDHVVGYVFQQVVGVLPGRPRGVPRNRVPPDADAWAAFPISPAKDTPGSRPFRGSLFPVGYLAHMCRLLIPR